MNNNSLMHIKGQASHVNFLLQISILVKNFSFAFLQLPKKVGPCILTHFTEEKQKTNKKTLLLVFDSGYKHFS